MKLYHTYGLLIAALVDAAVTTGAAQRKADKRVAYNRERLLDMCGGYTREYLMHWDGAHKEAERKIALRKQEATS